MSLFRPTLVEVDLSAIRSNLETLKPAGAEVMAVVKADAYGHGAVPVATAALSAGASWLGVALVEEGLALRAAGIDAPILVLAETPPGAERDALAARLTPTLHTQGALARLIAAGGRGTVHLEIDTGMHRGGVWPPERAVEFATAVTAAGLQVEGLWTHFARSEEDPDTTRAQLDLFLAAAEAVRTAGIEPRLLHAANSAATILFPESHLDLVRPGIALYGIEPGSGLGAGLGLRPALSWRSAVASVRRLPAGTAVSYGHRYRLEADGWVATVPVGYADGYPRPASSRAEVLVRGRRHRIAGTVAMDALIVDCGDLEPEPGEEVVLIGTQGGETLTAADLGEAAGTIAYEIVSRIGPRVPREHRP